MAKTRYALPPALARSETLTVRVTPREAEVVEAMCRTYECSISSLFRMLLGVSLPSTVPELNREGFATLMRIEAFVSEMLTDAAFGTPVLAEQLARIERALDDIRIGLLGLPE